MTVRKSKMTVRKSKISSINSAAFHEHTRLLVPKTTWIYRISKLKTSHLNHRNAFAKSSISASEERYLLLKLWAPERFADQRLSMSNQSRKRVSLRGEEVPACCYLCWRSALVTESLLLQAVTGWSPGKLFIPAAGSSPTNVGSGGSSLRQPGRRRESHRRKRQERQWQGGLSLHRGVTLESDASLPVNTETVTRLYLIMMK